MIVYKFGGASIKDTASIKNLYSIISSYKNKQHLIIVISAMGKTTNSLEKIATLYFKNLDYHEELQKLTNYHTEIANQLDKTNTISKTILDIFDKLKKRLNSKPSNNFDYEYDRIIPFGEILSTNIISLYLKLSGIDNKLLNAKNIIRTDSNYREANVNWTLTKHLLQKNIASSNSKIFIIQGFIGGNSKGYYTSLGREGSDYTAAIVAYCMNANEITVWKDVAGLYNADPKYFDNVVKIDKISYQDIIELSYYGASVIHSKTIKPLQNKNIPLYIKSFSNPQEEGTLITSPENINNKINIPCYILKQNQIIISVSPKDFSFINENKLSIIFSILSKNKIKVNLMQISAISFSFVTNNIENIIDIIEKLKQKFNVKYNNENISLLTIRYYDDNIIKHLTNDKKIILSQKSRTTAQFVLKYN